MANTKINEIYLGIFIVKNKKYFLNLTTLFLLVVMATFPQSGFTQEAKSSREYRFLQIIGGYRW